MPPIPRSAWWATHCKVVSNPENTFQAAGTAAAEPHLATTDYTCGVEPWHEASCHTNYTWSNAIVHKGSLVIDLRRVYILSWAEGEEFTWETTGQTHAQIYYLLNSCIHCKPVFMWNNEFYFFSWLLICKTRSPPMCLEIINSLAYLLAPYLWWNRHNQTLSSWLLKDVHKMGACLQRVDNLQSAEYLFFFSNTMPFLLNQSD